MTNPTLRRSRPTLAGAAVALIALAAIAAGGKAPPARPAAPAAPPAIQLVESVPVESGLGNPELPSAQAVWLEMIGGAKRTLDLEEFYLTTWPKEPLEPVLAAIGKAARRGVQVRLLLDAGMHKAHPLPADSLGKLHGITVRVLDMRKLAGGVQHAKFFMVDGREVFVGSQNLDWRALKHIHELGVRIRDERVTKAFTEVFEMDWVAAAGGLDSTALSARTEASIARANLDIPVPIGPDEIVNVWPSYSPLRFMPDSTNWDRDAIRRLLDSARKEIVVQLLTYSPGEDEGADSTLDQALRRAAARNVKVKLLVSDWEAGARGMPHVQKLVREAGVEAKLSTVPEWSGGYIPFARVEHCKYAVVDSARVWIGTANWEPGYFHRTRNVAVTLESPRLAMQARRVFETSWTAPGAARIDPDSTYRSKIRGETTPPGRTRYGG